MKEEIMNRIAVAIKEEFGSECIVQFQHVTKNNGLMLNAVIIREPGMTVAPIIYIDEALKQVISGYIDIKEVAQEIVNTYREYRGNEDFGVIISCISKESILKRVSYQLINAEKNENQIACMPHKSFLDLAVVYRVVLEEGEIGTLSFLINNCLMGHYGLNGEELDAAARSNTERYGFQAVSMDIIAKIIGGQDDEIKTGYPMWVLTNTKRLYGAVAMFYPDFLKEFANKIESDFYVLPSSIHEVIAVQDSGVKLEKLKSMVGSVNSSEVSEDEFLSGNVYKYIRSENKIVIAEDA